MPKNRSKAQLSLYLYICQKERGKKMDDILKKLKYGSQGRIAVLNAPDEFRERISGLLPDVMIDTEINARYLYDFMIAFTPGSPDVEKIGPACIHNLSDDGKLWMAYPKGTSRKYVSDINRDRGWNTVEETGFRRVGQVAIDNDWSALRFRNVKYVKPGK
jgi:hypothetical protein